MKRGEKVGYCWVEYQPGTIDGFVNNADNGINNDKGYKLPSNL